MNKKLFLQWLFYVIFLFVLLFLVPDGNIKDNLLYLLLAIQLTSLVMSVGNKVKNKIKDHLKYSDQYEIAIHNKLKMRWDLVKKYDENINYTFFDKINQFLGRKIIENIMSNDAVSKKSNSELKNYIDDYVCNQDVYKYIWR